VLVLKIFGKRPLRRSRSRWEDNTKIDLKPGRGFSRLMIATDRGSCKQSHKLSESKNPGYTGSGEEELAFKEGLCSIVSVI
jgi:hypothetical protein